MRELERLSGINRWILSLAEQGRLIPTGEEYEAVTAALRQRETDLIAAGTPPPPRVETVPAAIVS